MVPPQIPARRKVPMLENDCVETGLCAIIGMETARSAKDYVGSACKQLVRGRKLWQVALPVRSGILPYLRVDLSGVLTF